MNNEIIGQRIKGLRLKRKMTREELAEAAELSISFIYEIETGKKSFSVYAWKSVKGIKCGNRLHIAWQTGRKRFSNVKWCAVTRKLAVCSTNGDGII